jgi:hypothetical protein
MFQTNTLMKFSSILSPDSLGRVSSCWLALALVPILGAGCAGTFQEVKTISPSQPPAERPAVLVLGQVLIADDHISATEKELYMLKLKQGVEEWFAKTNTFDIILTGTNVPPHGIILSGTITEVNMGSAAERFWVGMGAGQERIQGEFEIKDALGKSLARFTARRSYLGGVGIGGAGMISMDELTLRLGETVAETISKWLHGQKVE